MGEKLGRGFIYCGTFFATGVCDNDVIQSESALMLQARSVDSMHAVSRCGWHGAEAPGPQEVLH